MFFPSDFLQLLSVEVGTEHDQRLFIVWAGFDAGGAAGRGATAELHPEPCGGAGL